jgi:prophage DNA circulation protein
MPEDSEQIFEQYSVASWTVRGDTIYFPIEDIEEDGGNRIVKRARPYRDGWKLDDTGADGKTFTITAHFNNSIDEDGIPTSPPLYPNVCNNIIESFDFHDTGTLITPTRGAVRCRAATYKRKESFSERDSATVTLTFMTDNEDSVDATSFTRPTVRATVQRAVTETTFTMESLGGFSDALASLEEAASNLQDAIAAPGELVQDVDQKASRVVRLADEVENQFLVSAQLGRDLLTDPDAWATVRNLHILKDRSARAVDEKTSPIAPIVSAIFETDRSIYDIAAQLVQDPMDLAALNSDIENLLFIPAGTVVKVFEKQQS